MDGLRALACLWVVAFHIRAASNGRIGGIRGLDLFVRSGSTGVSLFLVISGFSLYIPYANGRTSRFSTRNFLARRARRLMPAYLVSLAAIVAVVAIASGRGGFQSFTGVGLVGQTIAHATLIHQLFPSSFYALNGAYWSLGLEWELYLMLPVLISGVRRFGLAETVEGVVVVNVVYRLGLQSVISAGLISSKGLLATQVLPNVFIGRWSEFALGMVAAELYVSRQLRHPLARRSRWGVILAIPVALATVGNPLNHLLFGFVFFSLLCTVLEGDNLIARRSDWAPLVVLGTMSYSIYLVHQPVLDSEAYFVGRHGASATHVQLGLLALAPVVLVVAWLLFVTTERQTVNRASFADMRGAWLLCLAPRRTEATPAPAH